MFKNLFRYDSSLMIFMAHVTDCIFLSLFFLLGCIPIVTIGTSSAAMYDAIFRGCRKEEKNTWQRFLYVYRQNWKCGILPTILVVATTIGLGYGMIQCWNNAVYGNISWMVFSGLMLVAVLAVGVISVIPPMLSRFENSFGTLVKNAVILALANVPRTLVLGVLTTATILACWLWIIPVFLLPALAALLSSWLIEPMFQPYMPEEPEYEESEEEAAL